MRHAPPALIVYRAISHACNSCKHINHHPHARASWPAHCAHLPRLHLASVHSVCTAHDGARGLNPQGMSPQPVTQLSPYQLPPQYAAWMQPCPPLPHLMHTDADAPRAYATRGPLQCAPTWRTCRPHHVHAHARMSMRMSQPNVTQPHQFPMQAPPTPTALSRARPPAALSRTRLALSDSEV